MSRLQRIADRVWSFRREAAAWWPTPSKADALRFAFCEAGEALDALLRENPAYARNHAREVSIETELVQCAVMLVTALGPDYRYGRVDVGANLHDGTPVDEVARRVGLAFAEFAAMPRAPMWAAWAECALVQITAMVGADRLPDLVERELARVEARHMPERLKRAVETCARVAREVEGDGEE